MAMVVKDIKTRILRIMILIRDKYYDCGATLASELLKENEDIPKLRLQNINTIAETNHYLQSHYLYGHNKKFAKDITQYPNLHRKIPQNTALDSICYLEEPRKANNDWTIKFKGKNLQITRKHCCPAKSTVMARLSINGKIDLFYKSEILEYKII